MKIKRKLIGIVFLGIFLVFFLFLFNKVKAQSLLPLTVSPARQEFSINPGEKTVINVTFFNRGESAISGLIKVADFIVDNPDGTPPIIDNASQASPKFSASTWLILQSDKMSIASK